MPILEEQRSLCEDLERLEQACADRILEDPKSIRDRLSRDHQIANFVDRFQSQSSRLLELKRDPSGALADELSQLSTSDPFEAFYAQYNSIKDFHRRYPNELVENLERAYKRRAVPEGGVDPSNPDAQNVVITRPWFIPDIDSMFTGEEANGRFFDLMKQHEEYLNLPGIKRITYLQYLSMFDRFDGFTMQQKRGEKYFKYVTSVAEYLESFLRRTKPLENPEAILKKIEEEFAKAWKSDDVPGWGKNAPNKAKASGGGDDTTMGNSNEGSTSVESSFYCSPCDKSFTNKNVYDHHTKSKKHTKAAAASTSSTSTPNPSSTSNTATKSEISNLQDRTTAEREFRITSLTVILSSERSATATNVERKQSLTERERQMELEALLQESTFSSSNANGGSGGADDNASDSDNDDSKIYNPLKLPLAWDGKPIPYWLYKLHGLGVEFNCEICGNYVYMGRRAFDKHFNEHRHIHGLRCLGITNTTLFREITKIDEAQRLWEKLESDKKREKQKMEQVEEMEDAMGNVMPRKVFEDLQKQGLL